MGLRVLVTGAGGQVGSELVPAFAGHEVLGLDHAALDVSDRDAVLGVVTSFRPHRVVHAAAWTDVDACERDPDHAFRVNALGTRHVAEAARLVGAHLLYLSTDYVFSGERDTPYAEWDEPGPLSVYGRSKLAGEREVDACHAVVRISLVLGRRGRNFARTILHLAAEHDDVPVVVDQICCPTVASDLAPLVARLAVEARPGTFHATNQGAVSRFELARAIAEAAGLDPACLRPIATADIDPPRPAPRPRFSVLDNAVLRLSGLPLLPDFRDSLPRLVKELS